MSEYEILYQETWKAMPAYLAFGWRMRVWNNKEKNK
jgi:hypothetical protein